jgi:hypothetical protein
MGFNALDHDKMEDIMAVFDIDGAGAGVGVRSFIVFICPWMSHLSNLFLCFSVSLSDSNWFALLWSVIHA